MKKTTRLNLFFIYIYPRRKNLSCIFERDDLGRIFFGTASVDLRFPSEHDMSSLGFSQGTDRGTEGEYWQTAANKTRFRSIFAVADNSSKFLDLDHLR